jgi:AraC family transcriptional regulator
LPAGCCLNGWCEIEKPGSISTLTLDQSACSLKSIDLALLPPRIEFEDQALRAVLLRFQAILEDPSLNQPGYTETLAELLMFELARATQHQPRQSTDHRGLRSDQMRIITDFIDNNMHERISISTLAELLNLTRFHFIRSFKLSVGIPPHQYLIKRRIERAKELLREPHAAIAEVANKTGFGSTVHMARAFRRVESTSPSSYRHNNL